VYKNQPKEKNPLEGKKLKFVQDESEKENADGVKGHLEAISESDTKRSIYDKIWKRIIDIVLSFCGLVILSPILVILTTLILIDDPCPVLFTQKRIGCNKQYFKLHNVLERVREVESASYVGEIAA
jgi:O-antigen biosynthesis protein WbqP